MKILIVEDDLLIGFMLEAELTEAGHQVIGPACTVESALSLATATTPELALVNIDLKYGGNGVELARALPEVVNCPSLFVSGNAMEARKARNAALGFLAKPYDPAVVVASIEVAAKILQGEKPNAVPSDLELFRDALPTATRH
jgi:DNA-binding response OmpR family regulator